MSDEIILAKIGGTRSPILVKLRTWKGLRLFDVRRYFTNDGGLQPTRKGIGLRSHALQTLRALLEEDGDEIQAFLDGEEGLTEWVTNKRSSEETDVVAQVRFGRRALDFGIQDEGRGGFFSLRSSGDQDTITLNSKHAYVRSGRLDSNETLKAVTEVLAAYSRARNLLATDEEEAALFAELEHHWGLILSGYGEEPNE